MTQAKIMNVIRSTETYFLSFFLSGKKAVTKKSCKKSNSKQHQDTYQIVILKLTSIIAKWHVQNGNSKIDVQNKQ